MVVQQSEMCINAYEANPTLIEEHANIVRSITEGGGVASPGQWPSRTPNCKTKSPSATTVAARYRSAFQCRRPAGLVRYRPRVDG